MDHATFFWNPKAYAEKHIFSHEIKGIVLFSQDAFRGHSLKFSKSVFFPGKV